MSSVVLEKKCDHMFLTSCTADIKSPVEFFCIDSDSKALLSLKELADQQRAKNGEWRV